MATIREIIAEKKAKFRAQRSASRAEKFERLQKERIRLEKEKMQKDQLSAEKARIREIKTEKLREGAKRIGSGLQRLREGLRKGQTKNRLRAPGIGVASGSRDIFGGKKGLQFGPTVEKAKPKKRKKQIIINI